MGSQNEFKIAGDIAKAEAMVNQKTKLLIIKSPSNPTGGVLKKEDLADIATIMEIQAHPDDRILSDEVKKGEFPEEKHCYPMKPGEPKKLEELLKEKR